jgi:hypothetical protein
MGGNFEVLCRRDHTILLAGNYADEEVKPDWSIFPHAWEEI